MKKNQPKLLFAVLAADTVLFSLRENQLVVRLIPVHIPPFYNHKQGLPGGLIRPEETSDEAARRNLEHKAHVAPTKVYFEQLYTFSAVKRDPRGRVVAVAYMALVPWEALSSSEQGDSDEAFWVPVSKLPTLAYDHNAIIQTAKARLVSKVRYTTLISKIMPREFTLTDLEEAYQTLLSEKIDKRNFRKKILKLKLVKPLHKQVRGLKQRPAQLYAFTDRTVKLIEIV